MRIAFGRTGWSASSTRPASVCCRREKTGRRRPIWHSIAEGVRGMWGGGGGYLRSASADPLQVKIYKYR